jgi:hypothetical protein
MKGEMLSGRQSKNRAGPRYIYEHCQGNWDRGTSMLPQTYDGVC